jgi:pyrroline-5-carboxylate reductase
MKKLGFIGAGHMAEALLKGLITSGLYKKNQIIVSDIDSQRLKMISSRYDVNTTFNNKEILKQSNVIILAVKPDVIEVVLNEIKGLLNSGIILISIAAGITTSLISKKIKKKVKLVRVMPNTPALVLMGASVVYFNSSLNREERDIVKGIFESVGTVDLVENEKLLDAVTGLSGSGPAFVSMFIEALSDGGVKMGLTKHMALKLAAQTVYGTAKLVLEGGLHPAEFKDRVSSPAGTTIEGVHELELHGFRGGVISAVESAALRSRELSKGEYR